ncbi:MAG TPA: hypothetical protein VGQ51_11990, partial [Puia sp.]|nr:hypothetical protein [Puia sp.]
QVPNYPLPAGLSLKDGKDSKSGDIFFALSDGITVTQTQTTSFRTLFVNTPTVSDVSYVEGVYMAPDATKADGVDQAFPNPSTASWPTLGAKVSKYTPPMSPGPIDYPTARLGFILASKVLLMAEGVRKVHIRLACRYTTRCSTAGLSDEMAQLFMSYFASGWLIITQELIDRAVILGMDKKKGDKIRDHYLKDRCREKICADDDQPYYLPFFLIEIKARIEKYIIAFREGVEMIAEHKDSLRAEWMRFLEEEGKRFDMEVFELDIWKSLVMPQPVFQLAFSGPKGWVEPAHIAMDMVPDAVSGDFQLNLYALLEKDQDAVTWADKKALKEDFGTTDPLVKVQLNDTIKIPLEDFLEAAGVSAGRASDDCCLKNLQSVCGGLVSFYTFFRNVIVLGEGTHIRVTVCGVKNLVVQNDDNVLSAKKPFTPFGVKPVVPDFNTLLAPPDHTRPNSYNLIGPNFYIGSAEVFLKRWHRINVNINWKGVPRSFWNYYSSYIKHQHAWHHHHHFPKHQVNLALLHNGIWDRETDHPHLHHNLFTKHYNRHFFAHSDENIGGCRDKDEYRHTFHLRPDDFGLEGQLSYDPTFAPLTSFSNGVLNGYLRLTMENQDFLHKLYPIVMADKMIARAKRTTAPLPALPNEPWTPTILDIAIDYEAGANSDEMQLIQLYPYDGTYYKADINGQPPLFATFCDEGNLFIGLSGLVPGDGLNILFQLAEATADTEDGSVKVNWQYLASNIWESLRTGFEVLQDNTNGLSTTGIVQYSFPKDITNDNTVMPAGTWWLRASVTGGAEATSQTMAIITQAALAGFVNNIQLNDQSRPGNIPLASGSLTKLTDPDPNVQSVSQPYASFGGSAPEASGSAYNIRVSEQLRHKGRAIQKWDYERIVLQQFPKLLRAKCINHSYALSNQRYRWDFPMAPGNIILAVLPDPAQLVVADSLQPTAPMSMLTSIEEFLAEIKSPFVRVFARNPRYEPIDMCLKVVLQPDMNPKFYAARLETDIRSFMAPWKGNTAAFQFAQRFYSADLVNYIQGLDYIDKLLHLEMAHQGSPMKDPIPDYLDPLTPRSILVAGKIVIHVVAATRKPFSAGGKTGSTTSKKEPAINPIILRSIKK